MSRIVMAIGGSALLPSGAEHREQVELSNIRAAASVVASLSQHTLVVTHGSGPQVGALALGSEAGEKTRTLDVLGAEVEGAVGYLLEREIRSRMPARPVVTLLTQVEVDSEDSAFEKPTKPIGPSYDEATARRLAARHGWTVSDQESGWRRVVASPMPRRILELQAIALLLSAGHVVVCGGGGGIPVVTLADGSLQGVEAVIDKDRSSALLASGVNAEILLLLTDVTAVFGDWPERQRPLRTITPAKLRAMNLPSGSMGPKAEAAATFVEETGGVAIIGALEEAAAIMAGEAGTRVEG